MMSEQTDIRSHETILITVCRSRRLRGHKGDAVTSYAKVEFDGKLLGDSSKVNLFYNLVYIYL